jgi:hypothetical protein
MFSVGLDLNVLIPFSLISVSQVLFCKRATQSVIQMEYSNRCKIGNTHCVALCWKYI